MMEGWYYEAPDPSVGLFGGGWIHEDCPEDDNDVDTIEQPLATVPGRKVGVVETFYLLTCTGCAQQRIVVDTDVDVDAMFEAEQNDKARQYGLEVGRDSGSWVIDGTTSVEHCRWIIDGFNEVDEAVMLLEPRPLSGEYADGLTPKDVLLRAGAGEDADLDEHMDLIDSFEDGFSEGFWDVVITAARYQIGDEDADNKQMEERK